MIQARDVVYAPVPNSWEHLVPPYFAVMSHNQGGVFAYDAAGNITSRKTAAAAPVQTLA